MSSLAHARPTKVNRRQTAGCERADNLCGKEVTLRIGDANKREDHLMVSGGDYVISSAFEKEIIVYLPNGRYCVYTGIRYVFVSIFFLKERSFKSILFT